MSEVKVIEGYRITLPEEVRSRLRIRKGDKLTYTLRGREIILRAEHIPLNPTMRLLGLAVEVKKTPEEAVLEEMQDKVERSSKVSRRKHHD